MRLAIRYARSGPARYISHLDMQRAIGRAIRRARLAACYSQGFNPHLLLSFASPLSVGYETESDYAELQVDEGTDPAQACAALAAASPPGIEIRGVYAVPDGFGKLMARSHSAAWRIRFEVAFPDAYDRIKDAVRTLDASDSYIAADRRGREKDIIPLIHELSYEQEGDVAVCLANSSEASLNPEVAARVILREAGLEVPFRICRTECFGADADGNAVPFSELFGT